MPLLRALRWLRSYLSPTLLESRPSSISGQLELLLSKGRYMLASPSAVYSYEDLYHNFRRAFEQLRPENWALQRVLVLGMGLGSVVQLLEQRHHITNAHFTLVEIDPLVVEWAERYTLPRLKSPRQVLNVDALKWLEQQQAPSEHNSADCYDLIIVDIFVDDQIPDWVDKNSFLSQLRSLLRPNGKGHLLLNRLHDSQLQQYNEQFLRQRFAPVFPQHRVFQQSTNLMLYATS